MLSRVFISLILIGMVTCQFSTIKTIAGKQVKKAGTAIFWKAGAAVDADGAPNAYHPKNIGIDNNGNAGISGSSYRPKSEYGIQHKGGKRCTQTSGPFAGYYVSGTAVGSGGDVCNPSTWVNSNSMPYMVIPGGFGVLSKKDLGLMVNTANKKATYAWVADVGPKGKLGEASLSSIATLGQNPFLKNRCNCGFESNNIVYVGFPNSNKNFLRTYADVVRVTKPVFEAWGGMKMLEKVTGISGITIASSAVDATDLPKTQKKCLKI